MAAYRTIAVPPTPEAGAALTDAWGAPGTVALNADGTVTVTTDGPPANWPGSQGDPVGPWQAVYMGPPDEDLAL